MTEEQLNQSDCSAAAQLVKFLLNQVISKNTKKLQAWRPKVESCDKLKYFVYLSISNLKLRLRQKRLHHCIVILRRRSIHQLLPTEVHQTPLSVVGFILLRFTKKLQAWLSKVETLR